jgi:hypothetical protein
VQRGDDACAAEVEAVRFRGEPVLVERMDRPAVVECALGVADDRRDCVTGTVGAPRRVGERFVRCG